MFNKFFPRKSYRLWDNVEKYCRAGQATDDNMAHSLCNWIPKATDAHSEYVTLCFSTATMVAWTLLDTTIYVQYLSCLN